MNEAAGAETRRFDTEVHQLLKLMINALYSNREIFLRELISNASDACDRLRFAALTDESLTGLDRDLAIDLILDRQAGTLTVEDTGIGMNRDEVTDNIGTIARSGTRRFLESLSGDAKADARLIGQFGVGFYSAFIVADEVILETQKAGAAADGVRWSSDGQGEYRLEAIKRSSHGTRVTLKLKADHSDLLGAPAIRGIVRHYSNHVAFPIRLHVSGEGEGDQDSEPEILNDTQALWTRPRSEPEDADYRSFYTGLTGDPDRPLAWAHHHVEGAQRYTLLLYLPRRAPFDLAWNRDTRSGLKLYIQRVFIMDAAEELLPRYLRFIRGVVDSADLPLNISREILQDSPLLQKIRATVVKRSLDLIERLAGDSGEDWPVFWEEFGAILKEGIIEDPDHAGRIAGLLRFASTREPDGQPVGLADYVANMAEGQEAIWYLASENRRQALASPHLEAFRERDIEVLLMTDPVDSWLVNHLTEFDGKPLKSAAGSDFELHEEAGEPDDESRKLAGVVKQVLGDRVGNVRPSRRLAESPSCIVEESGGLNLQMRRLLRQAGQELPQFKPDLEINTSHPLVRLLASSEDPARREDIAHLLFEQALLAEGGELADPGSYVRRVNQLLIQVLDPSRPA